MRPHALLLLSALASCAAPREAAPPSITPIDTFGVEYTAHITRTGLAPPRQADACAAPAEGATSPTEQIEFACEVFELDSERLARLLGQELGGERGRFLAETEAEILAEHLRSEPRLGSVLMFPRVLTNSGQTGEVMTSEQTAFVSGYELTEDTSDAATLIADPVVSVAGEGIHLAYTATVEPDGDLALDLALRLVDAVDPFTTARVRLPGTRNPVTVQLPCFTTQSITTKTAVAPGRTLLLGPFPSLRPDHSLLLLVDARRTQVAG